MLINLSNHPSSKWPAPQMEAAIVQYGSVSDLPFPAVAPEEGEEYVDRLAHTYLERIREIGAPGELAVMVMGEMTLTCALVCLLKSEGYECVASTTSRITEELPDGRRLVDFRFVRFRKY